jgi:hypothetical protein
MGHKQRIAFVMISCGGWIDLAPHSLDDSGFSPSRKHQKPTKQAHAELSNKAIMTWTSDIDIHVLL